MQTRGSTGEGNRYGYPASSSAGVPVGGPRMSTAPPAPRWAILICRWTIQSGLNQAGDEAVGTEDHTIIGLPCARLVGVTSPSFYSSVRGRVSRAPKEQHVVVVVVALVAPSAGGILATCPPRLGIQCACLGAWSGKHVKRLRTESADRVIQSRLLREVSFGCTYRQSRRHLSEFLAPATAGRRKTKLGKRRKEIESSRVSKALDGRPLQLMMV